MPHGFRYDSGVYLAMVSHCGPGMSGRIGAECRLHSQTLSEYCQTLVECPECRLVFPVCGLDNFSYPKNTFDCVVSNLVLHYINDLDEIYKKVYRTLKPGGTFIFNIEHPIFTGSVNQEWIYGSDGSIQYWPIDNYFYTGERQTNFLGKEVAKQHHTLTQILMGLIKTGFQLEAVQEAVPPPEMMDIPGMSDELRRPMMLLVKCKK